jgi:hypothetical protein
LGLLLACAGCAGWTHPTKPESALPVDQHACEKEGLVAYPQVLDAKGADLNEQRRWSFERTCLEARGWRL